MTKINRKKLNLNLDSAIEMWSKLLYRTIEDGFSIEYSGRIKISDKCTISGVFNREINIRLMVCEDEEHNIVQIIEDGLTPRIEDRTCEID